MNEIEQNAILYYADFLSLRATSQPVTDNCKYFFIHGAPINSCYILNLEPVYDTNNKYYIQAFEEYNTIKNKFGEAGVQSFVEDICSIYASGSVNAIQMLKCIHRFSTKQERNIAFEDYYNWKKNQKYTRTTINEQGEPVERECTKYFYHVERMLRG